MFDCSVFIFFFGTYIYIYILCVCVCVCVCIFLLFFFVIYSVLIVVWMSDCWIYLQLYLIVFIFIFWIEAFHIPFSINLKSCKLCLTVQCSFGFFLFFLSGIFYFFHFPFSLGLFKWSGGFCPASHLLLVNNLVDVSNNIMLNQVV